MQRFHQDAAPAAKENQIIVGNTRITAISEKVIRVEKSDVAFTDLRTQSIYCRDYADIHPKIHVQNARVTLEFSTRRYTIDTNSLRFRVWIDGKEHKVCRRANLKGTIRTLDGSAGFQKLPDGLMSKSGVTVLDDSASCLLKEDGGILKRPENSRDFYILAFGRDYLGGLQEFYHLCGATPIIPKYALGNWWSRYHAYSDTEYLALMDEFQKREIPFTVSTVDMDWHLVKDVPKDIPCDIRFGRGWTGYTFNSKLFPDYPNFLKALQNRNLKVALNLHPKDGVRYFETQYPAMAKANGIDPETKAPVEFDLLDTTFRDSYFDILHHPYEKEGVDIWWIDWQQGTKSKMAGVDPLWLLNHYYYLDANREKPAVILSRYAGIGSHRYPLGFSGDTIVCWHSLQFQPYFTLCAANVGYTWWSHDIGGHMYNRGDNELYLRWLQLGCFSPINRLHSTNNTLSKEPWLYPEVEKDAIRFLRLRHNLIPYVYSAGILTHQKGIPICMPLYYAYDEPKAYEKRFQNEYLFGENLLVCPITKPKKQQPESSIKIWFPQGEWIQIFTGKRYRGDSVQTIPCPLEEYPVFAKAGSFLPLLKSKQNEIDYAHLLVKVFLGEGEYELLEDAGSILFTIRKENTHYKITAKKRGEIATKAIQFEVVEQNRILPEKTFADDGCIEVQI